MTTIDQVLQRATVRGRRASLAVAHNPSPEAGNRFGASVMRYGLGCSRRFRDRQLWLRFLRLPRWLRSPRPRQAGPRRANRAAQYRVHLLGRSCLPGHQRLWRSAPAGRDAEHRSPGQGRDAVRPLPGDQLDLRTQPGDGADRKVQPRQRFLQQHEQPVRRLADDLSEAAPGGGLPDGDLRQVAPGERADRLR